MATPTKSMSLAMWCDYEEGEPSSYRGIVVGLEPEPQKRFFTGPNAFLADLTAVKNWRIAKKQRLMPLSSLDHFVMDANTCEHLEHAMEAGIPPDLLRPCACRPVISNEAYDAARFTPDELAAIAEDE